MKLTAEEAVSLTNLGYSVEIRSNVLIIEW